MKNINTFATVSQVEKIVNKASKISKSERMNEAYLLGLSQDNTRD